MAAWIARCLRHPHGVSLEVLDCPEKPIPAEEAIAEAWTKLESLSPSRDAYEARLAKALREIGCAADRAPYVIRRLLQRLDHRFSGQSPELANLAAAFLNEANCSGARGLSEADKRQLRSYLPALPALPSSDFPG